MIFLYEQKEINEAGELATFERRIEAPSFAIAEAITGKECFRLIEEFDMDGSNKINYENIN